MSSLLHAAEVPWVDPETTRHRFETVLEPSSYTDEKFELFKKYQADIHHDFKSSQAGFRRFLCETPLGTSPIGYTGSPPAHLPVEYGSYHQLYKLDGELIAMAVLDILPSCVSSVYFMYDKKWERFSLGKLSAFRETSLAYEIHRAGVSQMSYLYMGFYIHSCPKMRYKGEYSPSFLADPETYEWYPLETCVKLLSKNRYACFSSPEHSISDPPPEYIEGSEPAPIPTEDLAQINIVRAARRGQIIVEPVNEARCWSSEDARSAILHCIHGLGTGLSKEVIFTLQF
ncbi:Arginyl-tRNA--protein transferase 1 [Pleurotus ostreatus]|nr:Arginyl-tRNA--protein transferase 1 [Pleurotus ostreatus]